jgi:tetratricopeptide (TPR) repeat protein
MATAGLARVHAARGEDAPALSLARRVLDRAPSISAAAFVGDLIGRSGQAGDAERFYALAEEIGRRSRAGDESLAGFLAERGRSIEAAVSLAEQAAARRQDVRTLDALAWAYFRAGRLEAAEAAAARSLRTGTRDRRAVLHAAAIRAARGDRQGARALVARAAGHDPAFDVALACPVLRLVEAPAPMLAAAPGTQAATGPGY